MSEQRPPGDRNTQAQRRNNYASVFESLLPLSTPHCPLSLPVSPLKPSIPSQSITALSVHPALEAALHILNLDLPSAHFLLRHMQSPPAWEAMLLHGVLHRIEGDIEQNAKAWYESAANSEVNDGDAEVWMAVWGEDEHAERRHSRDGGDDGEANGGKEKRPTEQQREAAKRRAFTFLNRVDTFRKTHSTAQIYPFSNSDSRSRLADPEYTALTEISLGEIRKLISFCEQKFGTEPLSDASHVWISNRDTKHGKMAEDMTINGEGWREF